MRLVISSGGAFNYAQDKFCREKSRICASEISRFARNDNEELRDGD